VQSIILTKVSDSSLLIVVTSSCFLKRIDMSKKKRQLAQIIIPQPSIYIDKCTLHTYTGLHAYSALVDLDSSSSPGVYPTPWPISSTPHAVRVCVSANTHTHTHIHSSPLSKNREEQTTPLPILLTKITLHASKKCPA